MGRLPIGIRPLLARDPQEAHRAATPLELFFDLITVIAIAAVTAAYHHAISAGHGAGMLANYVFLFVAIWWAWMNLTWFASAFDNDDPLYRLLVGVIMLGALVFAGGAARIFQTLDFSLGIIGWILMRMGMAALWLRAAAVPRYRRMALRYHWGLLLAQAAWTTLYLTVTPGSTLFLAGGVLCFAIELAVPVVAEPAGPSPWHRHHIIERYALLTLITLGEVMLSVATALGTLYDGGLSSGALAAAPSGFVIVFAIWWLYFLPEPHMPRPGFAHALQFGYLHALLFMAIALLGAGIGAATDLAGHHSQIGAGGVALFLGLPLAGALLMLWVIRDRHHRLGPRAAALPAAAAAVLVAALAGAPVWIFALLSLGALLWRADCLKREAHV